MFRGSVNSSIVGMEQRDSSMNTVNKEVQLKNKHYMKVQHKLEMMKVANEEIDRKKQLVKELLVKYPEMNITADIIVRCEASEIKRLVELLLFDDKLSKAALKI